MEGAIIPNQAKYIPLNQKRKPGRQHKSKKGLSRELETRQSTPAKQATQAENT